MKYWLLKFSFVFLCLWLLPFKGAQVLAESPDLKINNFMLFSVGNDPTKKDATLYFSAGCFTGYQNPEIKFLDRNTGNTYFYRMISCAQSNIEFRMCPGTYDGLFTIDSENIISESDETNNTFEKQFTVEGDPQNCTQQLYPHIASQVTLPDLEIQNVYVKNIAGESNKILLQIKNLPPASTAPKVKISAPSKNLSYTTTYNYTGSVFDIVAPGNPWPSGTYQVITHIDPDNEIAESDENNNIFSTTLTLANSSELQYSNKNLEMGLEGVSASVKSGTQVPLFYLNFKTIQNTTSNVINVPITIRQLTVALVTSVDSSISLANAKLFLGENVVSVGSNVMYSGQGKSIRFVFSEPLTFNSINEVKKMKLVADISGSGTLLTYFDIPSPLLSGEKISFDYPAPQTISGIQRGQIIVSNSDKQAPDPVAIDHQSNSSNTSTSTSNKSLELNRQLKGKIVLQVESKGEAWYISPSNLQKYYLGRPTEAFSVMREQGIGILNKDLQKIPVGVEQMAGADQDGDALSDLFEDATGLNKNSRDSDGDGHDDRTEVMNGFNPLGAGKLLQDKNFSQAQSGKILLQVEGKGEAWYLNPKDKKRYFLGRPDDAFNIMRNLSVGISNKNFNTLQ